MKTFLLAPTTKIYKTVFHVSKYLILVLANVLKMALHNHTDYSRGQQGLCEEGGRLVGRGLSHRRTRGRCMKRLLSGLTVPYSEKNCPLFDFRFQKLFDTLQMSGVSVQIDALTSDLP